MIPTTSSSRMLNTAEEVGLCSATDWPMASMRCASSALSGYLRPRAVLARVIDREFITAGAEPVVELVTVVDHCPGLPLSTCDSHVLCRPPAGTPGAAFCASAECTCSVTTAVAFDAP